MSTNGILMEIVRGKWFLDVHKVESYLDLANNVLAGQMMQEKPEIESISSMIEVSSSGKGANQKFGVVKMAGILTRYGGACSYGTEDYAQLLYDSQKNSDGTVLIIDGPGGSVSAMSPIFEFARVKQKPIAVVIGTAASASYWTAVTLGDRLFLENRITSEVGSIGVMMTLRDLSGYFKQNGIKEHILISDETPDKNKLFELVKEGKYDEVKKEYLAPLAIAFQDSVRANRPNLIEEPGVLTGKMFMPDSALKYGMADAIGNVNEALAYLKVKNELEN